jgi:ribosomal protein S6--L-glutamate ligase
MNVCLLVDRLGHPVLDSLVRELAERHGLTVTVVDVATARPPEDADAYLLKSRSDRALEFARQAELRGALVLNGREATAVCLDRVLMAQRMSSFGLPFPDTWSAPTLNHLVGSVSTRREFAWPIVVKSRRSRRGDLVRLVSSSAELRELASLRGDEAVIAQALVRHDGWDRKVWSIGGRLHCANRRSALGAHDAPAALPIVDHGDVEAVARAVGAAFGLDLYGVDVLLTEHGAVVVDVNPFPGFRQVPAAGEALAAHVIALIQRRTVLA